MPEPWAFVLLALVAFRLTRLVGWDDITARLRGWLGVTDADYRAQIERIEDIEAEGKDPYEGSRSAYAVWTVARLIRCPWCLGFWISILVAIGAALGGVASWNWMMAIALALSAAVGLIAKWLDP